MYPKRCIFLSATTFLLITLSIVAYSAAALETSKEPWEVDVKLASSIYLPTPRPIMDVYFVLNDSTPDLVYRVELNQTKDPANLNETAYATANETPHDTYKLTPNALGPFPKDRDLGVTMGEWIAAIGEGPYAEEDDNATINITFQKLIPNGTYSIWAMIVTMPPNYKEEYLPLGASDGSENVFLADAMGNATFDLKMKALPPTTNVTFEDYAAMFVTGKAPITRDITWTLIGVVYHSDGITHGATLGELGKTAHFQLCHLMYPKPAKTFEEWKGATVAPVTPPPAKKQPGFEGIFAIAGLLAVAFILRRRYE